MMEFHCAIVCSALRQCVKKKEEARNCSIKSCLVYLMNHENESVLSGRHGIKYLLKSEGNKKTLLCSKLRNKA